MKARFAIRFLLWFAVLLAAWGGSGFSSGYRWAALGVLRVLSPVVTGWWFEPNEQGNQPGGTFEKPGQTLLLHIDPSFLSMAQVPLAALILATPGLGVTGAVTRALVGMVAFFALHVAVLLVYPVVLASPNLLTDTVGVFAGLVSFVLAPQFLWFVLTYPQLRQLWRLERGDVGVVSRGAGVRTRGKR